MSREDDTPSSSPRRFIAGGLILGVGLGGLADGIVLHQILQWHNLTSARITAETPEGLRANLLWDGVFHLTTTMLVVLGFALLWQASQHQRHVTGTMAEVVGLVLIGWGAFHVVDQVVFHEVLGLHDIREAAANPGLYNWGFFTIGLALIAAGWALLPRRTPAGR